MEGFDSHLIAGGYSEDFLDLDVEARIWKYDEKTGERIDDLSTDSEEEEGEEVEENACKTGYAATDKTSEKSKFGRANNNMTTNMFMNNASDEESDCTADDDDENIFDEAVDVKTLLIAK